MYLCMFHIDYRMYDFKYFKYFQMKFEYKNFGKMFTEIDINFIFEIFSFNFSYELVFIRLFFYFYFFINTSLHEF